MRHEIKNSFTASKRPAARRNQLLMPFLSGRALVSIIMFWL
ncbi:hypothetical protein IMCC21224_111810 [Puniceibacterium sp. IMCC21224]|nr:hypothetical protein IMCC21224_111810 [Puniceibacterium sp. IMCC21224]